MRLVVLVDDQEIAVEVDGGEVRLGGGAAAQVDVDVRCVRPGLYSVVIDGRAYEVAVEIAGDTPAAGAPVPGGWTPAAVEPRVYTGGGARAVTVTDARTRALQALQAQRSGAAAGASAVVAAPMPGKVVAVRVQPGDRVDRDQAVVVLEAMKMESALVAPQGGTVVEVLVTAGQTVQQRQPLLRIEA